MSALPQDINGVYSIPAWVSGEGVPLRLEFVTPAHQNVQFGNLRVGASVSKTVRLSNQSKKKIQFSGVAQPRLAELGVSFLPETSAPDQTVDIRPRQSLDLKIQFAPTGRLPAFMEEVHISTI